MTEVKVNEEAETTKIVETCRLDVESKRLGTEEAIRLRTEDVNRAVQARGFTMIKEKQRLEQESQIKVADAAVEVERKRTIVVAEQKALSSSRKKKPTSRLA